MMEMRESKYLYSDLTDQIIKAYYCVYNELGYGFLEKVYENALMIELVQMGFTVEQQKKVDVYYKDNNVGYYLSDLIVDAKVIVEVKAAESICLDHECQLINYLKASDKEVGLLLNFGVSPSLKRKIFSNKYK
jgi:GxxExxY protein